MWRRISQRNTLVYQLINGVWTERTDTNYTYGFTLMYSLIQPIYMPGYILMYKIKQILPLMFTFCNYYKLLSNLNKQMLAIFF